jgi:hypothetical protein
VAWVLHLPYSCGGHHGGPQTLEPAVLGSGSRGAQTGAFSGETLAGALRSLNEW